MSPTVQRVAAVAALILLITSARDLDQALAERIAALPVKGAALNAHATEREHRLDVPLKLAALEIRPKEPGVTAPPSPTTNLAALFVAPPPRPAPVSKAVSPPPLLDQRASSREWLQWIHIDALMPPGAIINGGYVSPGSVIPLPTAGVAVRLVGVTRDGIRVRLEKNEFFVKFQ